MLFRVTSMTQGKVMFLRGGKKKKREREREKKKKKKKRGDYIRLSFLKSP